MSKSVFSPFLLQLLKNPKFLKHHHYRLAFCYQEAGLQPWLVYLHFFLHFFETLRVPSVLHVHLVLSFKLFQVFHVNSSITQFTFRKRKILTLTNLLMSRSLVCLEYCASQGSLFCWSTLGQARTLDVSMSCFCFS